MRKHKWLAVVLAVTMLLAAIPAFAGTESDPVEYPLYAGQDILVGKIQVWDDADFVWVKYVITEDDWWITETHLFVGQNIPVNRAGNPAPGQFPYKGTHDSVKGVTYSVPIQPAWDAVKVAAHAVVQTVEDVIPVSGTTTPELKWSRSSEADVVLVTGQGASWAPATQLLMATPIDDPDEVWDGGKGNQYFTGYSETDDFEWASWQHVNTGQTDLRLFKADFNLSSDIADNITQAVLRMPGFSPDAIPINDNIYIFLNGDLQFWGGTRVQGAAGTLTMFEGMAGVAAVPTYLSDDWGGLPHTGWYIPGEFPDLDLAPFAEGPNSLAVFVEENNEGGGMSKLELVLSYAYDIPVPGESDTAWAATAPGATRINEQGNWATYVVYTLTGN